jgi:hypothetical protein
VVTIVYGCHDVGTRNCCQDVIVVSKQAQVVSFKRYLIHNDGFWRLLFMYFLKDFFGA